MGRAVRLLAVAAIVSAALAVAAPAHALRAYVCCTSTIRLTKNGVLFTRLRHGTYSIRVADRSSGHNFHLKGYSLNRATGIPFNGVRWWSVRFFAGHTYTYICDAHPFTMRRTFRVF
jgi:hypothetical protein